MQPLLIRMKPPFRSTQAVIINAPLEAVWAFSMDITKIPEFHPRVVKVDLLSGKALREAGVSYQCHLSGGKHTCVEKDIEVLPMQKIVTVLPEDTFGISKILPDYVVETTFHRVGQSSTKVEISHYYSTPTLKAKLLNLVANRKIARDTCVEKDIEILPMQKIVTVLPEDSFGISKILPDYVVETTVILNALLFGKTYSSMARITVLCGTRRKAGC